MKKMNKNSKIKTVFIVLLSALSMTVFAQTKKVAILETVDKNGDVSYAYKLMLRSNLAKVITNTPGYEGYDRTDMEQISTEQNFQRTGFVSDDQIKKLGEITGAQFILVAEAVKVDAQNMFITAKILNVETAKMEVTDNDLMGMSPAEIQNGCERLANKLLGVSPSSPSIGGSTTVTFTAKQNQSLSHNQSDNQESPQTSFPLKTFPDGTRGVVFYTDNNNHGLVVSLDETYASWENVKKTKDYHDIRELPNTIKYYNYSDNLLAHAIGDKNTLANVNALGDNAPAASWCQVHGNGWYLPSVTELWYMLEVSNNKKGKTGELSKAIVRFGGVPINGYWYWSSDEIGLKEAINVSFGGWTTEENKTKKLAVRAVRAF